MKPSKIILLLVLICSLISFSQAQNDGVGINTDGTDPDASAILDVKSTTKGMLAPRMTTAQRLAIPSPAQGLLVYQTDAPEGFCYYDGTNWVKIGSSNNGLIPKQGLVLDSCVNIPVVDAANNNSGGAFQTTMYWQGFKANRTANLIGVSTGIWGTNPLDGYLRIYKGEGVSGQLLYQETVNAGILRPHYFWNNPIPIQKDSLYTIQVVDTLNTVSWSFGGGNTYPHSTSSFGQDLNFSTYVDSCGSIKILNVNGGNVSLNQVDTIRFADGTIQTTAVVDTDDQTLSLSGNNLSIADGNTVDLSTVNPDDQTLSLIGNNLSIADGNTVDLSPIDTKLNESEVDNFVSNNGYLTTEVDGDPNNELQTISKSGNTVTLSNGGGFFIDEINDADSDASNEIQTLSLNGSDLTISGLAGNTVSLPLQNPTLIQDADGNTKVQTEESPNENVIRFDVNGAERMRLTASNLVVNTGSGISFPGGFSINPAFVGSAGNAIAFGHANTSEDFIGYKNNTFYFKDSPGGGDASDPNISTNGTIFAGAFSGNGSALTGIDTDPANEIQTLSLSNDTLNLTGGSFVKLPGGSIPDTALAIPIRYHGSQIFVHPTDNASAVDWATAQTTCTGLTAFGFSDWYLPSRLELDAMYKQSYLITGLSQTDMAKYWSNTALDANNAYTQRLDYGGPDPDPITDTAGHNCRCVRKD